MGGRFITFEGGEGAGKTTLIARLADHLRSRGLDVLTTREPGAGEFGLRVREILLHGEDMPPASELFLFLADRANHVANFVRPALEQGKVVLCDRHADSTFVYQAVVRGLDADFVNRANAFATGGLKPETTLILDVDPAIGLTRLTSKDRLDAMPLEFHQAIRQGFLDLAHSEPDRFRVIDASQKPDAVYEAALAALGLS